MIMAQAEAAAKQVFPDLKLKPQQIDVLQRLANQEDVIAVLPTGYGKSILYKVSFFQYTFNISCIIFKISLTFAINNNKLFTAADACIHSCKRF